MDNYQMAETNREERNSIFIDSNFWFKSKIELYNIVNKGFNPCINQTVIYEVIKILDTEINKATAKKRIKRVTILKSLKKRFPNLLKNLGVEILNENILISDIPNIYENMSRYILDIGDSIILFSLMNSGITRILTDDQDWKRVPTIEMFENFNNGV